jgi:hypothetical protein
MRADPLLESDAPAGLAEALQAKQRRARQAGERTAVLSDNARDSTLLTGEDALLEIVYEEILLRAERGEAPGIEEYASRFPGLAARLPALFVVHRALEAGVLLDTEADLAVTQGDPGTATCWSGPGLEVSGYEILGEIGRGGMGVVYRARQRGLNRIVALKLPVVAGLFANPAQRARFREEAELASRLEHDNIVRIHEFGESDGIPYCALEYVEGGTLAEALDGLPQRPQPSAELVRTLALAAHAVHQHEIIHRDLKPANVLLKGWGAGVDNRLQGVVPKITDFGLATRLDVKPAGIASGRIVGTPSYMAPEQVVGQAGAIGPATDVYALGTILYEMLSGRPPFRASSRLGTLRLVLSADAVPLSLPRFEVPSDLETICLKCLEKAPARRYPSALALAEDLDRHLAGRPILARRAGVREVGWRWGLEGHQAEKEVPRGVGAARRGIAALHGGRTVETIGSPMTC